ncbi:hypothetical protein DUNSADRAFT_3915 [Dunaliella salina]|uniref:B box-type domain-containing protein n=1 Tax=Dunaliella salina TaxID=3046 RepID=A0ABQ7GT76_DUNSA|nr:hypothetical protein DUNSADRAFT_3915 [Dunaliella salina]|eukprot:KAF5837772.1 hypothetical protein DUNSADRAFT_3915 [Dunaliella salina]
MLHNVPLCEHCSSSVISPTASQVPNVSLVFCMNDGVFLCATCNDEVHKNKVGARASRSWLVASMSDLTHTQTDS